MQREAEGYNDSIYLMIAAPYSCFAVVGFFVYRGLRRKTLMEQTAARLSQDAPPAPDGSRFTTEKDAGG